MSNLDLLLNGDPITIKKIGGGNGVFKLLVAATVVMAIGSVGLYVHNNKDTIADKGVLTSIKDKINETIEKTTTKTIEFPIYIKSSLVNDKNKDLLNSVGNFEVKNGLADNQIARQVSQIQFSTGKYFLSLVSESEGFRSHLYNDNIGYALGNGWNISMQSHEYNTEIIKAIYEDTNSAHNLSSLSGKESTHVLTSNDSSGIVITPQRSMQVAELMGEKFEVGVIDGIAKQMTKNSEAIKKHKETKQDYKTLATNMYKTLQPNEKAAILYHCYKVGEHGFSKYSDLLNSLITYSLSDNKTQDMKKVVADKFTYKYKINGQILSDNRASVLVGTMFSSPEAFGYIIGKNVAPHNISSFTTALQMNHINGNALPGSVVIDDPFGNEREKIEKNGGEIYISPVLPTNISNSKVQNNSSPHIPYGYF